MHRRWLAIPLVASSLFCVAGACESQSTSDTDHARVKALRGQPVLKLAVSVATTNGAQHNSGRSYDRNAVRAAMIGDKSSATAVRTKAAVVAARLAADGWTIYYIACSRTTEPTDEAGPRFDVRGYRMAGSVSYAAALSGSVTTGGGRDLWLELLAPESHEPGNLFPDQPPAVPVTGSCLQTGRSQKSGRPITIQRSYSTGRPHHAASPTGRTR